MLFPSLTAGMHQHYPVELYMGLDESFKMNFGNGWNEYRSVIIDTNCPHRFDGSTGWYALLMIDPETNTARHVKKAVLKGNGFCEPDLNLLNPFIRELQDIKNQVLPVEKIKRIFRDIFQALLKGPVSTEPANERILDIIKTLKNSPEKKISAAELAASVNVSESRLAHIFKEETGIPIRRFLLWLRLIDAVKLIINGTSYTDAAHEAGFSDSAHLSRTYKKMFGVTPSDLLINRCRDIKIISDF